MVIFFVNLLDVHAKDLVPIPKKPETTTERRPPKKVPNWHLTSEESMKYIKTAHDKKLAEGKRQEKYDNAKKDAVAKVKAEEQRSIKVVTCLFKPAPRPPKAVKWVRCR